MLSGQKRKALLTAGGNSKNSLLRCRGRGGCSRSRVVISEGLFWDVRGAIQGKNRVCARQCGDVQNDGIALLLGKFLDGLADVGGHGSEYLTTARFDGGIVFLLLKLAFSLQALALILLRQQGLLIDRHGGVALHRLDLFSDRREPGLDRLQFRDSGLHLGVERLKRVDILCYAFFFIGKRLRIDPSDLRGRWCLAEGGHRKYGGKQKGEGDGT